MRSEDLERKNKKDQEYKDWALVKARAKEGGHYSEWLFVPQLVEEIERLRSQVSSKALAAT
jgi:hypothetical protein